MLIRSLTLISLVGIGLSGCFPLRDNSILENVLIETLARPVVETVVGGVVLGFNYVDDQLTETKPKDVWKYCQRSNGSLFQARVCSGGAITITEYEYENRKNKKPVTAIKATGPSEKMVYCKRRNGSVYSYTNVGSNQCAKNKKISKDVGKNIIEIYKRASNIIEQEQKDKKEKFTGQPESFLFKKEEEKNLYDKINEIREYFLNKKKEENYEETLKMLSTTKFSTDIFFENVVVNDENLDIKKIGLLY